MIQQGESEAVIRGDVMVGSRPVEIETEIRSTGRNRTLLNKQRVSRRADLLETFRVTVFSPQDLSIVQAGPTQRRRFLDDTLMSMDPRNEQLCRDYDKTLRQRNAFLKSIYEPLDDAARFTWEVWDQRLHELGTLLATRRVALLESLIPEVIQAYRDLIDVDVDISLTYESTWWPHSLGSQLQELRRDELIRRVTLLGPHRDDFRIEIHGLQARTHASQGEQRSLALALKLAAHRLITAQYGHAPILILDDVLSELDIERSTKLIQHLPKGQTFISTASQPPAHIDPDLIVRVRRLDREATALGDELSSGELQTTSTLEIIDPTTTISVDDGRDLT